MGIRPSFKSLCSATVFLGIVGFAIPASAGPVLIGALDFEVDTEVPIGSRFGFVLQMLDADNNFVEIGPPLGGVGGDLRFGPEVFWGDGESGRWDSHNTWTRFLVAGHTYDPSSSAVCLGYLPADVDNDRTSVSADILWLIDCLNGVQTCEMWQCDVDRTGYSDGHRFAQRGRHV